MRQGRAFGQENRKNVRVCVNQIRKQLKNLRAHPSWHPRLGEKNNVDQETFSVYRNHIKKGPGNNKNIGH